MDFLATTYPGITRTPRQFTATGEVAADGLTPVSGVSASIMQTDERGLRIVLSGITGGTAANLMDLPAPLSAMPDVSFVGEAGDSLWSIEAKGVFLDHFEVGNGSRVEGAAQRVTARRKGGSASHHRTLIGLSDLVAAGSTFIAMPTTLPDGSTGRSKERLLIPLPPLDDDSQHETYIHLVETDARKYFRQQKTSRNPVLTGFLVQEAPSPCDPAADSISEFREMIGFAASCSANVIAVYHIDDVDAPYLIELRDAPASIGDAWFAALPVRNPGRNYLEDFIARCQPRWSKARDLGADLAMYYVLDSFDTGYMQIRFVTLSVGFEVLASHYAQANSLSRNPRDSAARASGTYRTFGELLDELCASVGISWTSGELVQIRNAILHEGRLLPTADFDKYSEFVGVFHKIVLKSIGYSGTYYNVTTLRDGVL